MFKAELNRVAIVVKDIDKAMKDLEAMLGCQFYGPFDDPGPGLKVALPRRGGLELVSPAREDDAIGATKLLAEKGEGITGMGFRVDDIEEAERHMAELGLQPAVRISHNGFKEILYPRQEATHGLEIALNEFPDANGMAIEVGRDLGYEV